MMSTVPEISFSGPDLVNKFTNFQTGFTPWEMDCSDFLTTIHLEPVMPSESETGYVRIKTGCNGCDEFLIGSIKSNSGSDVTDCFNGVLSPQFDELDSEDTRIQINTKNSSSVRTQTGLIKSNSGSDVTNCFNGVSSPQSEELDSENTRIQINITNLDENGRRKLNRPDKEEIEDRKRKLKESNRESARRSRMRKQTLIKNLEDEVIRLGLENRELNNRLRIILFRIVQIYTENNRLLLEQELLRRRFSEMRQILILRQLQQNMI